MKIPGQPFCFHAFLGLGKLEELPHGSLIENRISDVVLVLQDGLDCPYAPRLAGRRGTASSIHQSFIEPVDNGILTELLFDIPTIHVLDRFNAHGFRWYKPHQISVCFLESGSCRKRTDEISLWCIDFLGSVEQKSDDRVGGAILIQINRVISKWSCPADVECPGFVLSVSGTGDDIAADVLADFSAVFSGQPLFCRYDQIVRVVALQVFGDIDHLNAVLAEFVPVITGFIIVQSTEPGDIITEDVIEVDCLGTCILKHLEEHLPAFYFGSCV